MKPKKAQNQNQQQKYARNRHRHNKPSHTILPSPSVLEAYEDLADGAAGQLLDLADFEQEHRHAWENRYLSSHIRSHRFGQICGLIITLALIYYTYQLAIMGYGETAQILAVSGFVFLMVQFIFTRRQYRKRPNRHAGKAPSSDR